MSIGVVGTTTYGTDAFTTDLTWSFDMPVVASPCLVVYFTRKQETGALDAVTYGGVAMTAFTPSPVSAGDSDAANSATLYGYYQINPSVGSNAVSATFTTARDMVGMAFALENVHQTTPFITENSSFTAGTSDAVSTDHDLTGTTSKASELVIYGVVSTVSGIAINQDAGQVEIGEIAAAWAGSQHTLEAGYKNGAASVDLGWEISNDTPQGWGAIAASFQPPSPGRKRAIAYYYDLYDPLHRILDEQGRVVPPWEVKADRWIKVAGLLLPSAKKPASFVSDPSVGYIESVTLMPDGSLDIKTSRAELTEVLLARAAGRTTL